LGIIKVKSVDPLKSNN